MNRFLLFAGSYYYPSGGWDDFKGSFETVEHAKTEADTLGEDWWHIVDSDTGEQMKH